ncbi:BOMB/KIRA PROTEINS [Salix purpurea]|uniref:BOMB/KIRA PROTEINS n=1 Tax=Salix purpurea TaxID=77065 RepID=A0A9Q1AK63_SALPP|nr:BOMB/KIRA PROTEINS [Salix purpurea]KAJ6774374.1 BOMB/KIRA PROTEINS [Salix purpurea]
MVSFETLPSPNGRVPIPELDDSSKKRKWEEAQAEGTLEKRSKPESTKSFFEEIELQLETPLPLEWQRCLDIQSGQIHFYNTRTHKRTSIDPRKSPEPPSPDHHMSLDLELNLPYDQSQRKSHHVTKKNSGGSIRPGMGDHLIGDSGRDKGSSEGQRRGPSWLESERDQQEMVATVCTKCHMLVMLCRSSPACPNCKFLHPLEQSSPKLFKQRLSLLWW